MKKGLTVVILALVLAVCAAVFSGCVDGVASESDLYGSFFTADNARCITLKEDNVAVVEYGTTSSTYYARYDLIGNAIELRDGDYWGDIVYTVAIESADKLLLTYRYTDGEGEIHEEDPIAFERDSAYDPA